jgi:hypothetical protein
MACIQLRAINLHMTITQQHAIGQVCEIRHRRFSKRDGFLKQGQAPPLEFKVTV